MTIPKSLAFNPRVLSQILNFLGDSNLETHKKISESLQIQVFDPFLAIKALHNFNLDLRFELVFTQSKYLKARLVTPNMHLSIELK